MYQLPLKPLRLGDLVSIAFRVFRADWRFLSAKLFWPSLLASVATSGWQILLAHLLQCVKNEQYKAITDDCLGLMFVLLLLTISQWIIAMRSTALYRVIFGLDKDFQVAMKYANRRKWAVFSIFTFGSFIPVFLGIFIALICALLLLMKAAGSVGQIFSIPIAFFGGLFLVLLTAFAILITTVLFASIATEDKRLGYIFKRTFELSFKYPLRGGSYICLLGVSMFLVLVAASIFLMPFELYETYLVAINPSIEWPYYLRVLEAASQTINNIISMSVAIVASGLYYRDVQYRYEGADLVERLEKFNLKT